MKAPEAVADTELVELILGYVIRGRDVKPQAKSILSEAKKICNVFESNLRSVKGVGDETLLFFSVLREFISRCDYQKIEKKVIDLSLSSSVYKFLKNKIGHSDKESFIILLLDAKNKLIKYKLIRTGFINSVAISARDIIEEAITHNANSVIIAHNHPSGDAAPSDSDLSITKQICHALKYTGINMLDHMIIAYNEYYSMNAHGYIKSFYEDHL